MASALRSAFFEGEIVIQWFQIGAWLARIMVRLNIVNQRRRPKW